jgi:hypothetical protein
MQLKKSVSIKGIRTELLLGLVIANDVYKKLGKDLVVTAVTDGKHKIGSLHFLGLGADLRTWFFKDKGKKAAKLLKVALGNEFDVVLEKDHIHLEYQPKT